MALKSFDWGEIRCFLQQPFKSALFLRKESTIVMAFRQCFLYFFFDTHELTKIVLQNFTVPQGFLFPRVTYSTGRDERVPFQLFWHCETFFKKNVRQRVPFNFFDDLRHNG